MLCTSFEANITSTSLIYADGKNRRVFSSDLFLVLTDATPSSHIKVPFLNLMSNIVERAGEVHIRCGGNTQEAAVMVEGNPNGAMIAKYYGESTGTACLTMSSLEQCINIHTDQNTANRLHYRAHTHARRDIFFGPRSEMVFRWVSEHHKIPVAMVAHSLARHSLHKRRLQHGYCPGWSRHSGG